MIADLKYDIIGGMPLNRFDGPNGAELYLVHTMPEFLMFFDLLMKQKKVAVDTETTGFDWFKNDRIVGMSFGWGQTHFYLPVRHSDSVSGGKQVQQLDMDVIRPYLQKFFARKDCILLLHNCRYDAHMFKADGIEIICPMHDTGTLWHFVDENAPGALKRIASGWRDKEMSLWHEGLVDKAASKNKDEISEWRAAEAKARKQAYRDELAARRDLRMAEIRFQGWKKPILKKWVIENDMKDHPYRESKKEDVNYGFVPIPMMAAYAALDTFLTWRLYEHCYPIVSANKKIAKIYLNEMELCKVLFEAEEHGVRVNIPYLQDLKVRFDEEIAKKEDEIRLELGVGPEVNIGSGDQLSAALITYGVVLEEKTDAGKWKMDKKVLVKAAKKFPIVNRILELRKIQKLQSTYVIGVLDALPEGSNILHASFNANVSTGRLSIRTPNLSNIPARDTTIRKAFIAPDEDTLYVFADYSQVEVRLTAHYSEDPILLDAYNNNKDVHISTSCGMFGIPYDVGVKIYNDKNHKRYKELKSYRDTGKVLNFSLIYGSGADGLADNIPRPAAFVDASLEEWIQECKRFIELYFETHRDVKKFIIRSNRLVRTQGFVENFYGRVRNLPWYRASKVLKDEKKKWLDAKAQRQGTNFIIQGTCADIFKMAIVRIFKYLKKEGSNIKMVNFVHDEIQFYVPRSETWRLPHIKSLMEDRTTFKVPVTVEVTVTNTNWEEKGNYHVDGLE